MHSQPSQRVEYVTIIAPTAAAALDQFNQQGLGDQGYSIAGQIGRHRVTVLTPEGADHLAGDASMVAATFRRVVAA